MFIGKSNSVALDNNKSAERKMDIKIFIVLVLSFLFLNVDGKAVGKKVQYDLGHSPSLYTRFRQSQSSAYETKEIIKDPNWQKSVPESEYSYARNLKPAQHYANDYSNQPYDEKYDLTNHENLEQIISDFDAQDLSNSNEKHNTAKPTPNRSDESLKNDQMFLHQHAKSKHINLAMEKSDTPKSNVKFKTSLTTESNAIPTVKNYSLVSSVHKETNPDTVQSEFPTDKNEARHLPININEEHESGNFSTIMFDDVNSNKNLDPKNIELESDPETLFSSGESENQELKDEETISDINAKINPSPELITDRHFSADVLDTSIQNEEDKHLFKMEINQIFDSTLNSFVFNPSAQPLDKFQECTTPKNESGFCRYLQHCFLPSILSTIQHFMENVCIIEGRFIGVCCPQFPAQTVFVNWGNELDSSDSSSNNSVEAPEDCGVGTNTRVVGGTNADRKAWPWMVALFNNKNKFFCGGSLINNRYVLTAAHCTFGPDKSQIVARLGEYDFNDPREPHDDYRVIEVKRHGQYNRLTLRNDIALLKLEKPVVFNEFIKTICFPEAEKNYMGDVATLAGWGHMDGGSSSTSDVLQEANFPIISNIQCSRTHGVSVPSSLICAATPTQDKGACNGDSGGPLMLLDENERWKVIGIVSWGRRGCNPKFPTVYSRTTHYMEWIRKHAI
ncbi:chymotrypsinogen A [Trichonephila clavata]|uniref:Chymotrypsinogen A n=1 Tax=Trichonephila clavata TaxID=2740835 RepID=A0A8X6KQ73_TRICU|nr:chymotrypsinogen A [Trichonephila clavata]